MNEEQKRAAYNAVVGALITLGVTNRDALYAAEAAVQCLSKWELNCSATPLLSNTVSTPKTAQAISPSARPTRAACALTSRPRKPLKS